MKVAKQWNGVDQLQTIHSMKTEVLKTLSLQKNGILVVQHGSGASNARLKIVESLKLKLRGSFLRFS